MKFTIYETTTGWRWRLRSRNGRIVADSGEAYSSRRAAVATIRSIQRSVADAKVIDASDD